MLFKVEPNWILGTRLSFLSNTCFDTMCCASMHMAVFIKGMIYKNCHKREKKNITIINNIQ